MNKVIEKLILIVIISSLFLPSFEVTRSLSLRLDDFIILLLLGPIFLPFKVFEKNVIVVNSYIKLYLLVILAVVFSCLQGYFVLKVPFSFGDLNEVVRLLKPLVLIIIITQLRPVMLYGKLVTAIIWGSVFVITIGVIQYFDIFNLGEKLTRFYAAEHHIYIGDLARQRVVLTGSGPNDGAVIALVLLILNLFLFIKETKQISLWLAIGLLASILFTSSRTVLICAAAIIGIVLFRHAGLIFKIGFGLVGLAIFFYVLPHFIYIYQGFQLAFEGENNSLLRRYDKWGDAYDLFLKAPVFGWGLAKSIHETVVDGEYFLLLRRFGVVGTILILYFVVFPIFRRVRPKTFLDLSVKYIACSALILMTTNNFFNSYQIITSYVIFVALAIKINSFYGQQDLSLNNGSPQV